MKTSLQCLLLSFAWMAAGFFPCQNLKAATAFGPWTPLFRGVDLAAGTNVPGTGSFLHLQVARCVRVDLNDPGVRLLASPRRTNWVANSTETYGYTVTNFLKTFGVQIAINANQFSPSSYFQAEGIACNANGMIFSQGQLVSPGVTSGDGTDAATFYFTSNNVPTYNPTNIPVASTNNVYTAVSGFYNILYNGVNIGSNYTTFTGAHDVEPRTALGISQNKRYLYLLTIDGRQSGYSDGAYDWETAEWLKLAGAWEGANMDGGGSSCMAMLDTASNAIPLNLDSASVTASGYRERTIGAHLGVYAAPLPGFFTNINALPADTTATIVWDTTNAATSQVNYGLTTNVGTLSYSNSILTTNHAILLTNLTANTVYYYTVMSSTGSESKTSTLYVFSTTNYVTSVAQIQITNVWKYATNNLDSSSWPNRTYDDSGWTGSGPGALWVDTSATPPTLAVPKNTQMPSNPGAGYPYNTYYFRTHFNFSGSTNGITLQLETYIDDGAVFYLNGTEIYRLRMASAPTVINNSTLAATFGCSGNATCSTIIILSNAIIATNLVSGDNVLAAEVHNYNAISPDITFGVNATLAVPFYPKPTLSLDMPIQNNFRLNWSQGGYTLQQADTVTGMWSDVSGPVVIGPFTTNDTTGNRYFRLKK